MIRVRNETEWSTSDLRRLYAAALRAAGWAEKVTLIGPRRRPPGLVVRKLTKQSMRGRTWAWQRGVRGHCYIGSHARPGTCTVFLATRAELEEHGALESFKERVAQVMHHEALHAVGARHRDMTDDQRYCRQAVPWAAELELGAKPAKPPKPEPEKVASLTEARAAHAEKMLARARTRAKRARTIERKWAAKVRYYERKQAAAKRNKT